MENYETEQNRISKEYIIENNKSDAQLYKTTQKQSQKHNTIEARSGPKDRKSMDLPARNEQRIKHKMSETS